MNDDTPPTTAEPTMSEETTVADALAVLQKEVPPAPVSSTQPAPSHPMQLSENDRLRIENLSVKLHNCALQTMEMQRQMQMEIAKAVGERERLVVDFNKLVLEFKERYGVDVTQMEIDAEGRILGPKVVPQGVRPIRSVG